MDDILTISKLDSGLFSITPLDVQPIAVLNNLLRMFEGEFAFANITQHLRTETCYNDLKVDRVLLDSSRLLQILINVRTIITILDTISCANIITDRYKCHQVH